MCFFALVWYLYLEDGPDTVLTTVQNNGASTLEDGRDFELTNTVRLGNDGVHAVEDSADTNSTTGGKATHGQPNRASLYFILN